MKVIQGRNAHEILPEALYQIQTHGTKRDSRNGPVVKFPQPTTIHYTNPRERVVFWGDRDCNPFFHLMEALWMLAGRNDVKYVSQFVPRMSTFSDDGETFHGAYGARWRNHFSFDQLRVVIEALRLNPDDRRCVVQMWDSAKDLGFEGKDFPCNTQVIFAINEGALDMSVFNRSNDLVWGALGANAVHFSFLQEYMAARIGVPVGGYWQISNNMHLYLDQHQGLMESMADRAQDPFSIFRSTTDPYVRGEVKPFPLMTVDEETWEEELHKFLENPDFEGFTDPFFRNVARPMFFAHRTYKMTKGEERYDLALEHLEQCAASDWKKAAVEWIERRRANYLRAKDDGPSYDN